LLVFASTATLALNIANPLGTGTYGKAAFDAVGPLLLIGWAEVGPGLLQAIATIGHPVTTAFDVEARPVAAMIVMTRRIPLAEPPTAK
jgi:hypothetical protein